jgi:hypothetical protein
MTERIWIVFLLRKLAAAMIGERTYTVTHDNKKENCRAVFKEVFHECVLYGKYFVLQAAIKCAINKCQLVFCLYLIVEAVSPNIALSAMSFLFR